MIVYAALAWAVQSPIALEPTISSVAVLKNGLCLVVRECPIPTGTHTLRIEALPNSLDGSFWYGATGNVQFSDATTHLEYSKERKEREVLNLSELLLANIGKHVRLRITYVQPNAVQAAEPGWIEGTIESFLSSGLMALRNEDVLTFINLGSIYQIDTSTLTNKKMDAEVEVPNQYLELKATAGQGAKLQILSMETGAAWASSYYLSLLDDTRAKLHAKAQLALGGMQLRNADVVLEAGMMRVDNLGQYDLASGIGSLQDYLRKSQTLIRDMRSKPTDPYERLWEVVSQAKRALAVTDLMMRYGGGFGGGGFGGAAGGMYDQQGQQQPEFVPAAATTGAEAQRVEGVFSYDFGKVTAEPGARITRAMFESNATYERLFVWADGNPSVQSVLRLSNTSGKKWIPGSCIVVRDGQLLAATQMPYTGTGGVADVSLGSALDMKIDRETRVIEQSTVDSKTRTYTSTYRLRIRVNNNRDEPATFEISSDVKAKILNPGGADVIVIDTFSQYSPFTVPQRLKWRITVPPQSSKELTATYQELRYAGP